MTEIWQHLTQKYFSFKQIGKGGYAEVYIARDKVSEEEVAIKLMHLNSKAAKKDFKKECEALGRVKHPNVVQLLDKQVIKSKANGKYGYMAMRRMDMDLLTYITSKGQISEKEMTNIFRRICRGVAHCHEKGVAHMDLKPDNVLLKFQLKNGKKKLSHVQICDFGFAKRWDVKKNRHALVKLKEQKIGTLEYRAPEIRDLRSFISLEKADSWSLGVLLFTSITGYFPFYYENQRLTSRIDFKVVREYTKSERCYQLICKMLDEEFWMRPKIADVLADPWLAPPPL